MEFRSWRHLSFSCFNKIPSLNRMSPTALPPIYPPPEALTIYTCPSVPCPVLSITAQHRPQSRAADPSRHDRRRSAACSSSSRAADRDQHHHFTPANVGKVVVSCSHSIHTLLPWMRSHTVFSAPGPCAVALTVPRRTRPWAFCFKSLPESTGIAGMRVWFANVQWDRRDAGWCCMGARTKIVIRAVVRGVGRGSGVAL